MLRRIKKCRRKTPRSRRRGDAGAVKERRRGEEARGGRRVGKKAWADIASLQRPRPKPPQKPLMRFYLLPSLSGSFLSRTFSAFAQSLLGARVALSLLCCIFLEDHAESPERTRRCASIDPRIWARSCGVNAAFQLQSMTDGEPMPLEQVRGAVLFNPWLPKFKGPIWWKILFTNVF